MRAALIYFTGSENTKRILDIAKELIRLDLDDFPKGNYQKFFDNAEKRIKGATSK